MQALLDNAPNLGDAIEEAWAALDQQVRDIEGERQILRGIESRFLPGEKRVESNLRERIHAMIEDCFKEDRTMEREAVVNKIIADIGGEAVLNVGKPRSTVGTMVAAVEKRLGIDRSAAAQAPATPTATETPAPTPPITTPAAAA
jgi:hypothetical protein